MKGPPGRGGYRISERSEGDGHGISLSRIRHIRTECTGRGGISERSEGDGHGISLSRIRHIRTRRFAPSLWYKVWGRGRGWWLGGGGVSPHPRDLPSSHGSTPDNGGTCRINGDVSVSN